MKNRARRNSGFALIEALVSVLLFSIGALGLLALQAAATKNAGDAALRSNASYVTNQLIAQMWVDRTNVDEYAHFTSGAACAHTGTASANAHVTSWITDGAALLPGFTAQKAQITVLTPSADTREVKVTVCWQAPQDLTPHNFSATAIISQ